MAGFEKLISFDMGGTSTDVAHYDGAYERAFETQVAGVRMRAPMMQIHTVAAGGGSILQFDGTRYRVGPDSAGANPGPACYRRGGPLTVTDANLMLGRIQPAFFPKVFGPNADQPLDGQAVETQFHELAERISRETGDKRAPEEVADGFRRIAVENMANAIKKISIQQGHDVTGYTLNCFGGAGGQHACDIADTLGMTRIFLHPFAGVLSAYGMGLADLRVMREHAVEKRFSEDVLPEVEATLEEIGADGRAEMRRQGVEESRTQTVRRVHLRYDGTDSALVVEHGSYDELVERFEAAHKQRFGFVLPDKPMIVEAVSTEVIGHTDQTEDPVVTPDQEVEPLAPLETVRLYTHGEWRDTPVFDRADLLPGETVDGPAIVIEPNSTTTIEPGWRAELTERNHLVLNRVEAKSREHAVGTQVDPVMLEVFNNLFMSVAEQMGSTLENTAYSVNIKERLDFSCAVFDPDGNLVANAPHMPVHLGSMGESVRTVIRENAGALRKGDVYMLNDPYNGGTHLPDITVITPVFDQAGETILFYVASRGHHADVGGITPGSMPPNSTRVEEEGVLIDNFKLVDRGEFREQALRELLAQRRLPRAQRDPEHRRPAGPDRRQREGRARDRPDGRDVRPGGRPRLHGPRPGQRRGTGPPRARRAQGRQLHLSARQRLGSRGRHHHRSRSAHGEDRLLAHVRPARRQLQRAQGGGARGRALRLPHAGRRRHPDERGLPEAARAGDPRRLDAEPDLSRRGRRRQRGDQPDDHRHALWRHRRDGGGAGDDEQLHLRQRPLSSTTRRSAAAPAPARSSTAPARCTPT